MTFLVAPVYKNPASPRHIDAIRPIEGQKATGVLWGWLEKRRSTWGIVTVKFEQVALVGDILLVPH